MPNVLVCSYQLAWEVESALNCQCLVFRLIICKTCDLNLLEKDVFISSDLVTHKKFHILHLFHILEDLHQLWVAIKASENVSCYYSLVRYLQLMVIYYLLTSTCLYKGLLLLDFSLFCSLFLFSNIYLIFQ